MPAAKPDKFYATSFELSPSGLAQTFGPSQPNNQSQYIILDLAYTSFGPISNHLNNESETILVRITNCQLVQRSTNQKFSCNLVLIPTRKNNICESSTAYSVPSILLTNACHVTNKITELSGIAAVNNPSFVIIIESNSNIPDAAVEISKKLNAHSRDCPTPGGGVLAYMNNKRPTTCLRNIEENGKEVLWLLLKPPRTPRPYSAIIVIGVYYPPGQTTEDERAMYEYVTNGLDKTLQDHPSAGVIIAGDFNKMRLNPLYRRFNLKKLYGLLQEVETFCNLRQYTCDTLGFPLLPLVNVGNSSYLRFLPEECLVFLNIEQGGMGHRVLK